MRTSLPGLLAVLILSLAAAGCGKPKTQAEQAARQKTLLLGNGAEPRDLDPQVVIAFTDGNICYSLFEGLTATDEATSSPVPAAAESWTTSPDGLVWTFKLRENGKWSNGDPVTAEDFAYSFRRNLGPKLATEYSYMLWPIKNARAFTEGKITDFNEVGVKALDAHTLQLTLGEPCPWLLALATHQSWLPVPKATIEKFNALETQATAWTRPGNHVGNGPFKLVEWTPNSRIVVEKNPNYWNAANTKLEKIVFLPNDNMEVEERNFRAGQVHITYELPPDKIATYQSTAPEKLRVDPFLETFFLRFNVNKPPFDNVKVRQALARAIDRKAIAERVLHGSRLPAHAYVPPNTAGYNSRASVPDDFAAARKLLAEAGFPDGKGFPTVEVQIKSDAIHRVVLEAIQEMWKKELGITITIAPLEQKVWLDNQVKMFYTMQSSRWIGDYNDPNTFLDMYVTNGGNNNTGYSNPKYDALVAETGRTLDVARRHELQQQTEEILLNDVPIVPVLYGTRVFLIDPAVKGWVPSLLGTHQYQKVSLEP